MSDLPIPPLHSNFSYRIDYVGLEKEPVLVIDDFVGSPELLVDWAELRGHFVKADAFYPGIRAKTPTLYSKLMCTRLQELICDVFNFSRDKSISADCKFSIVTTPPSELLSGQSIPHYDSLNRGALAAVHYLCSSSKGGTSIYRHRATGFESVSEERIGAYREVAFSEAENIRGNFIDGDNEYYQRVASYDAVFNRLIMYRCTSLHSGNIARDFDFDPNPRTGRLTIASFIFQ